MLTNEMYCRRLRNEFSRLSQGFYGAAYLTRDGRVLKVTTNQNDGWPIFIAYALQHQGNPHLPRIDNWKARRDPNGEWRLSVVMERLNPLKLYTYDDDKLSANVREAFSRLTKYQDEGEILDLDVPDTLKMTMIDLAILCKANNLAPDLHGNNFMCRDDGTLVITDPFSEGNNKTTEHFRCGDARWDNMLLCYFMNPYAEPYSWGRTTTFPSKKEIHRPLIN